MTNLKNIIMKNVFVILCLSTLLLSCDKKENNLPLDPQREMSFSGTFQTMNSDNISGTVTLNISNGYYVCQTNLPFGSGAGIFEINDKTLNFIDTLFFQVPSIYGPSYVLSGSHDYRFDGEKLEIWKKKNVGEIIYKLTMKN